MKPTDLIKNIPTGSPAGEILKIAALIAATILVDKIGDVVEEISNENKPPQKSVVLTLPEFPISRVER